MEEVELRAQKDKAALRARLRAARAGRDAEDLANLGAALAEHGAGLCAGAAVVAAYAAIGDEPPTRVLLDRLVDAGMTVLLPMVRPDGLSWSRYDGWQALADRGGLLEPAGTIEPDVLTRAELVLAPALAVDRTGNRLGRGGGYYDRALVGVPRDRIVAVVFADEVLDVVPVDPHDVPVGAVLTPDGLVPLRRPDVGP
jgi:5-formyltetrahydrofolate cyclo-ligase